MSNSTTPKPVRFLQEFSIPLLLGVVAAMFMANVCPDFYHDLVHKSPLDFVTGGEAHDAGDFAGEIDGKHEGPSESHAHQEPDHNTLANAPTNYGDSEYSSTEHSKTEESDAGHATNDLHSDEDHAHGFWNHIFTMHFLVNDIFMVFFFGVAAKEITEACLPGGPLNPISKAINPLLGTLGGILGPVGVFLALNLSIGQASWANGWGIPTATDIALAWLAARFIFGARHPAITFLLLLAVADDAIGLGIIAIAYPDPLQPTQWMNALWIIPGMASALALRLMKIHSWIPYVLIGGAFCWWGLYSANLHPALTLVFVVPFMPGPKRDLGLYVEQAGAEHAKSSPLENFEHDLKLYVDFGLFFFAFANAGVSLAGFNNLTWILLASLLVGKTLGITLFSFGGHLVGFRLPHGISLRHLITIGVVAGIGLTVALFVSGQAFTDPATQGAAKMGALLSGFAFCIAMIVGRCLGIRPLKPGQSIDSPITPQNDTEQDQSSNGADFESTEETNENNSAAKERELVSTQ